MGKKKSEPLSEKAIETVEQEPVEQCVSSLKWTAKELASEFGYNVRTINRLASKLYGVGKQGTVRYYTPDQKAELMLEVIAGCGKTSKRESLPELALEKDTKKTPLTAPVKGVSLQGKELALLGSPEKGIPSELAQKVVSSFTLQNIAELTGADYSTVADYASKAGWTKNGKLTVLTAEQATIILEAMKGARNNQYGLVTSIQGIETEYTAMLRIKLIHEQRDRLYEQECEIYKSEINRLQQLNDRQTAWIDDTLKANQQLYEIAEAGGLITSDKEDTEALYKRGKKAKK